MVAAIDRRTDPQITRLTTTETNEPAPATTDTADTSATNTTADTNPSTHDPAAAADSL
jgi:hypothetical protein